jgi:hypothetical protein
MDLYLVCLFALASAAAVALIRPQEIDHEIARGGEDKDSSTETNKTKKATAIPIADLFKRRELIIFLASVVLFHLGNAAMLPMAGQVLAKKHGRRSEQRFRRVRGAGFRIHYRFSCFGRDCRRRTFIFCLVNARNEAKG